MSLPYIKIGIFGAINTKKVMLPQPPLLHGRMGIIATPVSYVMSCYLESWRLRRRLRNPREHCWRQLGVHQRPLGYVHPRTGKLYFCGRTNDVTHTGGESVLANEIDRVVASACDGTLECAVFALPDKNYGEAICAAIVLSSQRDIAGEARSLWEQW